MIDNRIINSLHLDYRKDKRVIRQIVYHPIFFAKSKIVAESDWLPIRIRYFGVFLPKNKHEPEKNIQRKED